LMKAKPNAHHDDNKSILCEHSSRLGFWL